VPTPPPTITSITPAIGLASGDSLVSIVGTGFNVPVDAPDTNSDYDPLSLTTATQTVLVYFDGVLAEQVWVRSSTLIEARIPPGNAGSPYVPPGRQVTVMLVNVAQGTMTPLAGQSVSVPNAFTYALPILTSEYESDLARAIRTLLQLMKGQLLTVEVNYAVQTDYDANTGDELHVTKFAKLPGIVIVGPDMRENRFYSQNEQPDFDDGTISKLDGVSPAGFFETRVPYTVDLVFDVIGASDNKVELLNLEANFISFMHKNKFLYMNRSATDASKGEIRWEMDFEPHGQPKNTTTPNNSNLRSWEAKIVVRGFDIETFSGLATDGAPDPASLIPAHAIVEHGRYADDVVVKAEQLDDD
jgi:hypothetical protein